MTSERQKVYEDSCRKIADELVAFINRAGASPAVLLAKANVADLFNAIRTAYENGRVDEREGIEEAP